MSERTIRRALQVCMLVATLAACDGGGGDDETSSGADGTSAAQAQPDVLLVVLDTVRADHSSAYGYGRPTTIQLDALAQAGVLFEDVTAPAPWTLPSHASLFTGEPPWVHGAHSVHRPDEPEASVLGMQVSSMRTDLPTLAERFSSAGYETVALVVNDWLVPEIGVTRGFERVKLAETDGEVAEEAVALLQARSADRRPLFLFLNLMNAHAPYMEGPGEWAASPREWLDPAYAPEWLAPYLVDQQRGVAGQIVKLRGVQLSHAPEAGVDSAVVKHLRGELEMPPEGFGFVARLYDAGVRGADFSFGRVLETWATWSPDSVLAVTSDHGEAFDEHGLLEHRGSVYPEMLRVPLVLAAPGRLPAAKRVRVPVQLHDLHDALLELAGLDAAGTSTMLAAVAGAHRNAPIEAAAWPVSDWAATGDARYQTTWHLYRVGNEALVWSEAGHVELYDLASDPRMERDRAAQRSDRVEMLLARAQAALERSRAPDTEAVRLSDDLRERLSALGYLATGDE